MTPDDVLSTNRPDLSRVTALVIDHDMASHPSARGLPPAVRRPRCLSAVGLRGTTDGRDRGSGHRDLRPCPAGSEWAGVHSLTPRQGADQGGATPAIAVTFFYERFGVRETRAAGFDMFVRKPIDPMDIVQAVTLLVRRPAPS